MKKKLLTGLYQKWFMLLTFALLFINYSYAQTNHAPVVSNVHVQQRPGTRLIDITYDVEDADGDFLEITVKVSTDNGKTYSIIPKSLIGDVGKNIRSGKGKKIVWDAKKDMPTAKGSTFKIKITADDGVKTEKPKEIIGKDGAPMLFISAGEFLMGSNDEEDDEKPVHKVYLDAFYIDKYEVTNAQYKKFMDATGYKAPRYWNDPNYNAPDNPVVGVSWYDAKAYADWAEERLPTEAEWEKAARGGLAGKKYVWGDEWDPPKNAGNFADETAKKVLGWSDTISGYDDGYAYTAPVGKFNPNGYGLYDMAGNVWEWCADWYDPGYYAKSPKSNPAGPSSGSSRVLRGGSWGGYIDSYLRAAFRYFLGSTPFSYGAGFRCAGF